VSSPTPSPLFRPVSGRYAGIALSTRLALRVDIDGRRRTTRLSGDLFKISGRTTSYFGSFIVNSPSIKVTRTQVTVRGRGDFSWCAEAPIIQVTIPRRTIHQPLPPATLQFLTS
jgi:hypothetical protein